MYDHLLRQPKRVLFEPLARRIPVAPNTLTAVGLLFGLLSALMCAFGMFGAALAFWLLNRLLDGIDGEVARAQNAQTDFGAYLDILADLLVYACIPLGIAFHWDASGVWKSCLGMLASFYVNLGSWMYLSSLLEKRGQGAQARGESTSVAMPRGLIEGAETVLFFTWFLLAPHQAQWLFAVFACLTFLGAALRVRWASRILNS